MCSPSFQHYDIGIFMIAKTLRLVRQYHEMTRLDASSELGIPKDTLIQLESGILPVTKPILEAYSKVFDIPVSSLVFFSESLSPVKNKRINRIRSLFAGKALKILEWVVSKNESKINS